MDSPLLPPEEKEAWRQRLAEPGQLAWGVALNRAAKGKGFWKQTWPGLIKLTLEANDVFAFTQLVLLKREPGEPLPPLPDFTLDQLHAFIQRQPDPDGIRWGDLLVCELAERLRHSEQRLSFDTWASVADRGGWNVWSLTLLEETLPEFGWYQRGRAQWLTDAAAREVATTALQKPRPAFVLWSDVFDQHWSAWPTEHREELVQRLSEFWCSQDSYADEVLKDFGDVYRNLHRTGVDLTSTAWAKWWEKRLDEHGLPKDALSRLKGLGVAFATDPIRPPPGLTWSVERAFAWGKVVGQDLCATVAAAQVGIQSQHEQALFLLMNVDRWLTAWGLQTAQAAQAFEAGVATSSPHWEDLMQEGTPNLRSTPQFAERRAAWKALRLERMSSSLPTVERPPGRVRM